MRENPFGVMISRSALNLVMVGIRVLLDPPLLGMPGGLPSALEPAALLTLDALIVIWATRGDSPVGQAVVREGSAVGLVSGALEVVQFNARVESASTGGFLVGLLLLWGIASPEARRPLVRACWRDRGARWWGC